MLNLSDIKNTIKYATTKITGIPCVEEFLNVPRPTLPYICFNPSGLHETSFPCISAPVVTGGHDIKPYAVTANVGNILSGNIDSVQTIDNNYLVISELTVTAFDVNFTFEFDVHDNNIEPHFLYFTGYYQGNPAHRVKFRIYNNNTSSWVDVTTSLNDLPSTTIKDTYSFALPNDLTNYINNNNLLIKIIHTSSGFATHRLYIDQIKIACAETITRKIDSGLEGVLYFQMIGPNAIQKLTEFKLLLAIPENIDYFKYGGSIVNQLPNQSDILFNGGIMIIDNTEVKNISKVEGSNFVERASMDMQIRTNSRIETSAYIIEHVDANINFKIGDKTITENIII